MNWKHFKREEFACKHCGANKTRDELITALDELRERVGFPLPITSGYRCPVHNARVSNTGSNGPHTTGWSADLGVDRQKAHRVLQEAARMGCFTGIGVQQKGASRFIHLDMLPDAVGQPRPTIWSY